MSVVRVGPRLTEFVTVKRLSSHSSTGDLVRGTTLVVPARVQRDDSDVPADGGRARVSDATVITEVELRLGDMLFFAEDDTGNENTGRVVKNVAAHRALDGTATHYTSRC